MRDIKYIVLHCTSAPANQTTEEIKQYWKKVNGWKEVGYHYLINENGSYDVLQALEKPTNGVKGHNAKSIHICYKGGQNGVDTRTDKQKQTMEILVRQMHKRFPNAEIKGHRDFLQKGKLGWKDCPSFDVADWLKSCKIV